MLHVFTICDDMASRRRQPKERGLPIDHARARNPQDLLLCDNGGTRAQASTARSQGRLDLRRLGPRIEHQAGVSVMKFTSIVLGALSLALSLGGDPAAAQGGKSGVERLYILNCGEGRAGDISRWSPGVNVGQSMDFVDSCYLIKHAQGWFLWDTGVTDAIAAMPDGQAPSDPRATHWRRPKTLAAQLDQLGVKPSDIKYVAVSHTHPDHRQRDAVPAVDAAGAEGGVRMAVAAGPRFKPEHPVTKLEGDHDVFGDGSVTIIATPDTRQVTAMPAGQAAEDGRCCCRATPCTSRTIGRTVACHRRTPTRTRPSPRCSAWPT